MATSKPNIWDLLKRKPGSSLARSISHRLRRSKSYKHSSPSEQQLETSLNSLPFSPGPAAASLSRLGSEQSPRQGPAAAGSGSLQASSMSSPPSEGMQWGLPRSSSLQPEAWQQRQQAEEGGGEGGEGEGGERGYAGGGAEKEGMEAEERRSNAGSMNGWRSEESSNGQLSAERVAWCKEALKKLQLTIAELERTSEGGRKSGFDELFEKLRSEASRAAGGSRSFHPAILQINKSKNRYSDVLPYEESRVVLAGPLHSAQDGSDYINASYVTHGDSSSGTPLYIATQGPLDSTAADFWRMAAQQQCKAIIMLTREVEGNRVKCGHYLPLQSGQSEQFADIIVTNQSTEDLAGAGSTVKRRLVVREMQCPDSEYSVDHFLFSDWPDHGVQRDSKSIRALINSLQHSPHPLGPFLIHCSAGIGRTGTFCCIDLTLRRIERGELAAALDIAGTVQQLRSQRRGMVQTKDQFKFCFTAVRDELAAMLEDAK